LTLIFERRQIVVSAEPKCGYSDDAHMISLTMSAPRPFGDNVSSPAAIALHILNTMGARQPCQERFSCRANSSSFSYLLAVAISGFFASFTPLPPQILESPALPDQNSKR
jgi:hypothetical protein